MLVLHALAVPDCGYRLWAEDTAASAAADSDFDPDSETDTDTDTDTDRVDAHPFAASSDTLAAIVGRGSAGVAAGTAPGPTVVTVTLPSTRDRPGPSPEFAAWQVAPAAADPGITEVALRRWLVPSLGPGAAGHLLEPGAGGTHWLPGATLPFLRAVEEFAADLVSRGRLLPALRVPEPPTGAGVTTSTAQWTPVLTGADLSRFEELRDEVPPAFRAGALPHSTDAAESPEPVQALRWALDAAVDRTARDRLRGPAGEGLGVTGPAWVAALRGDPLVVTGRSAAGRRVAERLAEWRAHGARAGTSNSEPAVRTCFRLREPRGTQEPGDCWRVEFLLRSAVDPTVLVNADQVWAARGRSPLFGTDRPDEDLLAALGRAVTVWPAAERAMVEAEPTGIDLDAEQAYDFLRAAGALQAAGFGVLLPAWWRRAGRPVLTLTARPTNPVSPVLRDSSTTLAEIVDFRWGVSLGGTELTEAELAELAAAKVPLVQVRGQWAYADPALLAAGLDLARRVATGQPTVRDVLRYAGLGPAADPAASHPETADLMTADDFDVRAEGWLAGLLPGPAPGLPAAAGAGRRADQDLALTYLEFVDPPRGLGVALRPYQRRGLAWLAFLDQLGLGALLADDMGLGKTVQLLALELFCRADGSRPPSLVVCPTSVVGNWVREVQHAAPSLRVLVHHGDTRLTGEEFALAAAEHDLVVTTYPVVRRDVELLCTVAWDRVTLDEAQFVKNGDTGQARAVRRLPARHRVALTGTPVENRLADLWSVMDFLNPGLLGGPGTFRARYAVPIERYRDDEAAARLRRRIRPVVLRRVKSDPAVLDELPEKIETRQLCTLTTEQVSLYQAVVDDMLERLADPSLVRRKGVVLAAMTKLKQVCNHPAHLLGDGSPLASRSGKLARLEELLDQVVADGERALCFTQFARFGAALAPYLADRFRVEVQFLHGGTARADRDALVERFQTGRGPGIFLLSLKAGGFGLNLTAANHVMHLDRWWNPASEAQATDRAYRIGQRRGVQVHTFVCMGTLEERVDRMLADKASLARTTISTGEGWLAGLTTDQLRDLVTLVPPTAGAARAAADG